MAANQYLFGIDLGGTTVKCGLFSKEGEIIEKWEIRTRKENNGSQILPDIAAAILNKMEQRGIGRDEVIGVGIDVPGPVNENSEIAVAVNLNWGYKDIKKELGDLLGGIKVKAVNDANAAALGEMWRGGGKGCKDVVMVTLGTGVGGGIIVNGKIVAGAHGAGGEVGHAYIDHVNRLLCNCGNRGCLETVTSATGVVHLADKYLESANKKTVLKKGRITCKTVFDALKAGDEVAAEIVAEFADILGRALAVFACVVDPEVFVIGGGVSNAGQVLIDAVTEGYKRYAFVTCQNTPIVLATLGNDAGMYGSARLMLD